MTQLGREYVLRSMSPRFAFRYITAHLVVIATIFLGSAWLARGSQFGLHDPVSRFVLPSLAVMLVVLLAGLVVLLARRPASAAFRFDGDVLHIPKSWLMPTDRMVSVADVRSVAVLYSVFGRRLLIETGTAFGVQCAGWWFESPQALEQIHARIEASLLECAPGGAERERVLLQSRLGLMTKRARPMGVWAGMWLLGFYLWSAWLGNTFDAIHLTALGANATWLTLSGEVWRLASSATLHMGPAHMAVNLVAIMLVLPFGCAVVGRVGGILIFAGGAICGAIATAVSSSIISVGASPGMYGYLGAFWFWGFACRGRMALPFATPPRLTVSIVIVELAIKFAYPNTDTVAHFGGALGGAAVAWALTGRSLTHVGVRKQSVGLRAAAACVAATFVLVPAWSFTRGAWADPNAVAIHAIDAVGARDQKKGVAVPFGLRLCFSPDATGAQIERASGRLSLVPARGALSDAWKVMVSCFDLRLGRVEPAWQRVRRIPWRHDDALRTSVIASIAHEAAEAGLLPWDADESEFVDLRVTGDARHVEVRRRETETGSMGVDLLVESEGAVVVAWAGLRASSSHVELGVDDLCGVGLDEGSVVTLIDVFDWPAGDSYRGRNSRCAAIGERDVLSVIVGP